MSTIVTIELLPPGSAVESDCDAALDRAFEWFHEVERVCNRFDPASELRRATLVPGAATHISEMLFGAVQFALSVAVDTDGAFDPAIGARMESRGFHRDYRTGAIVSSGIEANAGVDYRAVHLDADERTITIDRPLVLDLGAVAKGLAIDLAARELEPFRDFAIDAGGDLFLGGHNSGGRPWSVGIRHPQRDRDMLESIHVANAAVCTTAGDERPAPVGEGHHVLDPRTGSSPQASASATVVARTAMVADAFATAAFVLGPADGLAFLRRHGVQGVIFSSAMQRFATPDFGSDHATVFPDA